MPAIPHLRKKIRWMYIRWPNKWIRQFMKNRARARKMADKLPLVHVTHSDNFEKIVSTFPIQLETSKKKRSKPVTLRTQKGANLGDCLYWYAGRARKDFGDVALAFDASCEKEHTGEATPFDTGDLREKRIMCGLNLPEELDKLINDSAIPLVLWREDLALFMAGYFSDPLDYLAGRPNMLDPEEIFQKSNNKWPAWTFEVRFHEDHDLSGLVAATYDDTMGKSLLALAEKAPPFGPAEIDKLIQAKHFCVSVGSLKFRDNCERMDAWVKREIKAILL